MPRKSKKARFLVKQSEKEITKTIRKLLDISGIWHFKHWSGPMTHPKGISDIIGIFKGQFLAIEVKVPGKSLAVTQAAFLERISREGGIAFVAYGVDDVIRRLGLQGGKT